MLLRQGHGRGRTVDLASLRRNLWLIFVDLSIHLAVERIFFQNDAERKSVHNKVLTFSLPAQILSLIKDVATWYKYPWEL